MSWDESALAAKPDRAPEWITAPATVRPITSSKDFVNRANAYFQQCYDTETRPTITALSLAVGLPGPTALIRLAQRIPELRFSISRCMTAVAQVYENMIGHGNATGPIFMLKNIPDFDPEEPEGSPGVQFFNDRKEILLQAEVVGAATMGEDYDSDADPVDVYLSVIKRPTLIGPRRVIQPEKDPEYKGVAARQILTIIEAEGD